MSALKFEDIKDELQQALQEKLKKTPITNENGFALIEGFMSMPIQAEIGNSMIIDGPNILVIGLVGNTSGRVYTFALKAILPSLSNRI